MPVPDVLAAEMKERLLVDGLWPLRYEDWDDDTFYSLIEVVHDLIARPRHRDRHNLPECSWHYWKFAPIPGQSFYRWQVDRLMARYGVGLRLAAGGVDAGRLVGAAGDDRDELVDQVLQSDNLSVSSAVRHSIALFRRRGADRDSKRSAVVALQRVREDRRPLIKTQMMSKDEGDLFQIANLFEATVELTNRLIAGEAENT